MHEARIEITETGRQAADDGWFILNLAEMGWETLPGGGTWSVFESPAAPSQMLGIGVHILQPGETPGFYHAESEQEGFLVLSGECIAVVEGQERRLHAWDYLHCPPHTRHITIGAGDGPCAILMVGTRTPGHTIHYPADPGPPRTAPRCRRRPTRRGKPTPTGRRFVRCRLPGRWIAPEARLPDGCAGAYGVVAATRARRRCLDSGDATEHDRVGEPASVLGEMTPDGAGGARRIQAGDGSAAGRQHAGVLIAARTARGGGQARPHLNGVKRRCQGRERLGGSAELIVAPGRGGSRMLAQRAGEGPGMPAVAASRSRLLEDADVRSPAMGLQRGRGAGRPETDHQYVRLFCIPVH